MHHGLGIPDGRRLCDVSVCAVAPNCLNSTGVPATLSSAQSAKAQSADAKKKKKPSQRRPKSLGCGKSTRRG